MKYVHTFLVSLLLMTANSLHAQHDPVTVEELQEEIAELETKFEELKHGLSGFLLTGFTNLTYRQDLNDPGISKFEYAGFSPMFLWKISDNIFFESELHIEMKGGVHGGEIGHNVAANAGHEGSSYFDLGYANMAYITNSGITISAGKFLTPIGIYNERYHPTWINPLPVDPIGMGHGGFLPPAELGIQVRGGLQTGASKLTYGLYLSNGPVLNDGIINHEYAGKPVYSNFSDNNANKAFGARLSYLPLSNSSLEIGLSGQYSGKIGDRKSIYEEVDEMIYSGDINYYKLFSGVGLFRLSGQYTSIKVGDAFYRNSEEEILNGAPEFYTFENVSMFYYASVSLRLSQTNKPFLNNSEIIVRHERGLTPLEAKWHIDEERTLIGYTYWLHIRSALKLAGSLGESNVLYAQVALGF
ncbi:MAG: hypothetical protein OEY51_10365 [Cyclobacteriaceae bacterium]|nr:hypothetical protein [Cyclobacteriaceae bacterium]